MKIRYHVLAREDIAEILQYYKKEAGHEVAVEFFEEFHKPELRVRNFARESRENTRNRKIKCSFASKES